MFKNALLTNIQIEREEKSCYRTRLSIIRENCDSETTVLIYRGGGGHGCPPEKEVLERPLG